MQGVTRSPYPSFTIDESFQAFLNIFSSYIEPTHGLLFAVECTNIGFLLIRFGYHNERYSLRSDFHKPFSICLSFAYALQLEVVYAYQCFRYRLRVQYIVYGNPYLVLGID